MWQLAAKLTRSLPAETAHSLTVQALRLGLSPVADQVLAPVKLAGLGFDNPVGLEPALIRTLKPILAPSGSASGMLRSAQSPRSRNQVTRARACFACLKMVLLSTGTVLIPKACRWPQTIWPAAQPRMGFWA